MKEDVLEQIVDDYLRKAGYLTTTNVRYRPSKTAVGYKSNDPSVHTTPAPSDIGRLVQLLHSAKVISPD